MRRAFINTYIVQTILWLTVTSGNVAFAGPHVEFDFARVAECRDVAPTNSTAPNAAHRIIEMTLPVSVRFRGAVREDVEELDIEINGAAAGLRVVAFSPSTQLASEIAQPIESITTTKRGRSLDGTLGGGLPVPVAGIVAHVSPSISAGISGSETATEKLNRLPPKHAIVVSGTSSEGQGVFFKLKRSSQTSLEGVHELKIVFAARKDWKGGIVHVTCSAHGQRSLLWLKQSATLGREAGDVRLYSTGSRPAHNVAKPVVEETPQAIGPTSFIVTAAAEVVELVDRDDPHSPPEHKLKSAR
jgi:hypothetical protein